MMKEFISRFLSWFQNHLRLAILVIVRLRIMLGCSDKETRDKEVLPYDTKTEENTDKDEE